MLTIILGLTAATPAWARHRGGHTKRLIISLDSHLSDQDRANLAQLLGLDSVEDLDNIDEIIVEVPDNQLAAAKAKLQGYMHVQNVEDDFYVKWIEAEGPASFQALPFTNLAGQVPVFTSSSRRKPAPAPEPDPVQPAPTSQGQYPWGISRVNAPAAWNATQGDGVRVAVIDTGIDCSHPNLNCSLSDGINYVDPSADPMDDQGHGTHVSGTIAGQGQVYNGTAVFGVAPKAHLIPVKVLDAQGGGSVSNIVKGINWAASHGAQVINMSLGAPQGSASLQAAINRALAKGVTIVVASGNEGPNNGPSYPAAYPGVIAVAASDSNDQLASFSSRGDYVSFIAPGVKVLSSMPGGKYGELSGTSMATPHVTGLAALAIAMGANGPDAVASALQNAATKLCSQQSCLAPNEEGVGMIDAAKIGR
jgi:subtilisin family serine protease